MLMMSAIVIDLLPKAGLAAFVWAPAGVDMKGTTAVDTDTELPLFLGRQLPQRDGVAAPTLRRFTSLRPNRTAFSQRHGGL
jgi:hypothetical protein